MKLMIDIPDSFYSDLKENRVDLGTIGCQLLLNKVKNAVPCGDMGEVSDGYHTFNQLYHQRAILFAAIVNQNKGIAWKSYKHSDGKYCFDSNGEWFIVGIDTPEGSYTYHYSKEYWDYFKCKELDCGKEWDGHTEEDVTRLLSLEQEPCEELDFVQPHKKVSVNLEPCTDAISRLAVLNLAKFDGRDGLGSIIHAFDVEQLPPVNPTEKVGRWEWVQYDSNPNIGNWHCSECRAIIPHMPENVDNTPIYKWCPYCGAKMQEVKNDR